MKLASAQIKSNQNNVEKNLIDHHRFIKRAADYDVDIITFPEMSITGYLRENADRIAFNLDDVRLDELRNLSSDHNMVIIAGAPIQIESNLYIGSFIIKPDGTLSIYTKQYLHTGEDEFFQSSFDYNPVIEIDDEKISFAICADIDNPLHPDAAYKNGSTFYMPSIFFSTTGISGAHNSLSLYAQRYSMNILLSNYCGKLWGSDAGGGSAFWLSSGDLITALDRKNSGLVIVRKENGEWAGKNIKLN